MDEFIKTLKKALTKAGVDYEITYLPGLKANVLRINNKEVFLLDVKVGEKFNG